MVLRTSGEGVKRVVRNGLSTATYELELDNRRAAASHRVQRECREEERARLKGRNELVFFSNQRVEKSFHSRFGRVATAPQ